MDSDEVTMALLWSLYGVEWLLTSLSYTEKTLHIERFNTDLALQFFTIILKNLYSFIHLLCIVQLGQEKI